MKTYIALFRGVNVGGRNILPMKELKVLLEQNNCSNVRTYIQSGNVVFRCAKRPDSEVTAHIKDKFGFKPEMLILDEVEFRSHPKTYVVTRMSEDFVVKAGGEKGSEACRCTSRTFFADNADPRNLQPFAVNRGLGMASNSSLKNNPFQTAPGKTLHFFFCKDTPRADAQKLKQLKAESEEYCIRGKVFYLYAPNGIGRSKLVSNIESCLGVSVTGRNLNTINKLRSMIESA